MHKKIRIAKAMISGALYAVALLLLLSVSWQAALGVMLFVWARNVEEMAVEVKS